MSDWQGPHASSLGLDSFCMVFCVSVGYSGLVQHACWIPDRSHLFGALAVTVFVPLGVNSPLYGVVCTHGFFVHVVTCAQTSVCTVACTCGFFMDLSRGASFND